MENFTSFEVQRFSQDLMNSLVVAVIWQSTKNKYAHGHILDLVLSHGLSVSDVHIGGLSFQIISLLCLQQNGHVLAYLVQPVWIIFQ